MFYEMAMGGGSETGIGVPRRMINLCVGPHIPHTSLTKSFLITKSSAIHFLGSTSHDSLQRICGIFSQIKKGLVEYKKFIEEAAKRDHRTIGKGHASRELFLFAAWNEVMTPC